MSDLRDVGIEDVSDWVYEKLEDLEYKQVLSNPTTEDNEEQLIELHTPLKSVGRTENAFPLRTTFQMSITCWATLTRKCMEMTQEVETKLQEFNFTRTSTSPAIYDSVLQKYGITITFEVRYNAITDAFEFVR